MRLNSGTFARACAAGTFAAVAALASAQAARAQAEGPWCAMIAIGADSTVFRCDMPSLERCLVEIRGQGVSQCVVNPNFSGRAQPARTRSPRQR